MLSRAASSRRATARCAAAFIAAACLAGSQDAQAVPSFNIPQACNGLASGAEDELDPVVLITYNAGNTFLYNFPLNRQPNTGQWYVTLQNPVFDYYFFVTTYTPFLTSTLSIHSHNRPSDTMFLPAPGVSQGSTYPIFPIYRVAVMDSNGANIIPGAIVDFIPAFTGSSPYTMQADQQGVITINCLQAESTGYAVTVYSNTGDYIYDGGFQTLPIGQSNITRGGNFGQEPTFRRPGGKP